MITVRDVTTPHELRYDALASHVGCLFGPTAPLIMSQQLIEAFAGTTGDRQWVHVDADRATRELGGTIAHGYLILSLIPRFTAGLIVVTGVSHGLNYGVNRVRFPASARAGSAVVATQAIIDVEPKGGGTLVKSEMVIKTMGGDRPTCVAETLVLLFPGDGRH